MAFGATLFVKFVRTYYPNFMHLRENFASVSVIFLLNVDWLLRTLLN